MSESASLSRKYKGRDWVDRLPPRQRLSPLHLGRCLRNRARCRASTGGQTGFPAGGRVGIKPPGVVKVPFVLGDAAAGKKHQGQKDQEGLHGKMETVLSVFRIQ